jgi:hypothetical protein
VIRREAPEEAEDGGALAVVVDAAQVCHIGSVVAVYGPGGLHDTDPAALAGPAFAGPSPRRRWWRRAEPFPEAIGPEAAPSDWLGPDAVPDGDPGPQPLPKRVPGSLAADAPTAAPAPTNPPHWAGAQSGYPGRRLPIGNARLPGDPLGRRIEVSVDDSAERPVAQSLTPGGYYLIRFVIRPEQPGGRGMAPGPGPGDPDGTWLEVAVITEALAVPPGPHPVFLPVRGPAWFCACVPGGPHSCLQDERAAVLGLPFIAPRRPGTYRVHLAVRQQGAVLHQTRVELPVGTAEVAAAVPRATVTFSLAADC